MSSSIDLYWLPLGAGGRVVRLNGRIYEALVARRQHRSPAALFHAALQVTCDGVTNTIEMAPVWNERSKDRGVVVEGPVGSRLLGRSRLFRYEVRCWRDGRIPDVAEAVDSPQRLSDDPGRAAALLSAVPAVPAFTWGRDELGVGDMWNSNSLVAWALASSGQDMGQVHPPAGGRVPGWQAGLALAAGLRPHLVDAGAITGHRR